MRFKYNKDGKEQILMIEEDYFQGLLFELIKTINSSEAILNCAPVEKPKVAVDCAYSELMEIFRIRYNADGPLERAECD